MTTPSNPLHISGFLFLGDPHLWSLTPGRRRDDDFTTAILGKLTYVVELANRLNYQVLCLGDFFHNPSEKDTSLLTRVTRILRQLRHPMVVLEGNHDKDQLDLTDANPLMLMHVAGTVEVWNKPGLQAAYQMPDIHGNQRLVYVGGTGFGQGLPLRVERPEDAAMVVWLSHDDYAFHSFPGAIPLREIEGVDMVVNGHMHGYLAPMKLGSTAWFNPGNITRLSIDQLDHEPAVWLWSLDRDKRGQDRNGLDIPYLEKHVVPHAPGRSVFNLEGRHTRKLATDASPEDMPPPSLFAQQLRADDSYQKTDDGTFIREALAALLDKKEASQPVRAIVEGLMNQSIQKEQA